MDNTDHTKSFEESLTLLSEESALNKGLNLQQILEALSGNGYPLLLIILAIPFCQPIQIPGLSIPFGLIIVLIGLRISFGHRVWVPETLLKKSISHDSISKMVIAGCWLSKKMRKFTALRLSVICHHSVFLVVNGLMIAFLGMILLIPIPIPLSNTVASWAILFISLGMLESDGVFVGVGYAITLFCLLFIFAVGSAVSQYL